MGLFNDLPAPAVSKPAAGDAAAATRQQGDADAQLEAQLAKLRRGSPPPHGMDHAEDEEDEEGEGMEGQEDIDEEEGGIEGWAPEPVEEPSRDLRRRPRARMEEEAEEEEEAAVRRGGPHAAAVMQAGNYEAGSIPHQRQQQQQQQEQGTAEALEAAGSATELDQPQRKRVRISEAAPQVHEAPPPKPLQEDEVTMALRRIASHISNPAKFAKACPLLRKLLDGDALRRTAHQAELFATLRAAFLSPETCTEPLLRREYMKLIAAIAARADLFGKAEKAHLDVYRVVGHVQNELSTDDSFVFNKALGRIREALDELSEATEEDDALLSSLQQRGQGNAWAAPGSAHAGEEGRHQQAVAQARREHAARVRRWEEEQVRAQQKEEEEEEEGEKKREEEDPEADPFGLDSLMAAEQKGKQGRGKGAGPRPELVLPPAPAPATTAWSGAETAVMRREAMLACLRTCQTYHKNAWARTGVELLIEHCYEQRARFCAAQHPVLEELMTWVKQQRAARKQGPSAKEVNRDSTAFERARAEWSKATVSHRGKVGGGGDAKAQNWLG